MTTNNAETLNTLTQNNKIIEQKIKEIKDKKMHFRDRVSKKIIAVFYLDSKYYKKKKQKMKKVGETFEFEGGTYVLDDKDSMQIGRKTFIFYDLGNPLPLSFKADKNTKRNSKVLNVLVSKRTLKALFGNPDKWYIILAVIGLGAGITITSIIVFLLTIGKLVIK